MKRAGKSPYELAVAMGLVGAMDSAAAAGRDHSLHLKKALRYKRREPKLEIGVSKLKTASAEFVKTARALDKGVTVRRREQLFFADMPTLLKTLTSERWRMVEHLKREGPLSINALSQQLGRNYKNVHGDVKRLMEIGLVERLEDGRVRVPYSSIIAELKMAA